MIITIARSSLFQPAPPLPLIIFALAETQLVLSQLGSSEKHPSDMRTIKWKELGSRKNSQSKATYQLEFVSEREINFLFL